MRWEGSEGPGAKSPLLSQGGLGWPARVSAPSPLCPGPSLSLSFPICETQALGGRDLGDLEDEFLCPGGWLHLPSAQARKLRLRLKITQEPGAA